MDHREALQKLNRLLELHTAVYSGNATQEVLDEAARLYGQVDELIWRLGGLDDIVVEVGFAKYTARYKDYVAASLLSGRSFYQHQGRMQLIQVIAKLERHLSDPSLPQSAPSLTELSRVLHRFRECCQSISSPPKNERDVQDILWIVLRSHFDRLDREDTLPRFGIKSYKPDFGVPDLRVLVEAKYVGELTKLAAIQEEILADLPGYIGASTGYDSVAVFVYDAAHKLRDPRKFIEDLRSLDQVFDVVVIPGIG